MPTIVGIRFKKAGKVYYFDPGGLVLPVSSGAIVETARGIEYGNVVVSAREVPDSEVVQPLKRVVRRASEADLARVADNRQREKEAMRLAQNKITDHNLDMYLVDIEYAFDGSKITFYFTAEGRVDFRDLVKDLAAIFRTRIELRQIGVRDEAKMLGGLGPCGRPLCCSTFLGDFAPVSIRMAKDQNLSLNPTKISGVCGRLLCCLRYEADSEGYSKKGKAGPAAREAQDQNREADLVLDLPPGIEDMVGLEAAPAPVQPPLTRPARPEPPPVTDRPAEGGGSGRSRRRGQKPPAPPQAKPNPGGLSAGGPNAGGPKPQDEAQRQKRRRRRRRRGGGQGAGPAGGQASAGHKPSNQERPER